MAETIKVSTEKMRETIQRYRSAEATLFEAYQRMNRTFEDLGYGWKGKAFADLRVKWTLIYSNIKRARHRMNDAIEELDYSAHIFDRTEEKNKSGFESLSVGSSPFN